MKYSTRFVASLVTSVCAVAVAAPAHAQVREFNIHAGNLKQVLEVFTRQTRQQLLYRISDVRAVRSPGVRGSMSDEAALKALLAGTGFEARQDSSGAFAIGRVGNGGAPSDAAAALAQNEAREDGNDNEIVVTASKREERLQNVAGAVTAVSSKTIENLGISTFRDYAALVPGLAIRGDNGAGTGTIVLRGLNTGPQQVTNTTVFYLDETPFSSSGFLSVGSLLTPSPELAEMERIEVLKGPQGTLYGASSLGGVIRMITKKPDPSRFYGAVGGEVSFINHGGTGYMARGQLNLPIISDRLAISASAYHRETGGFADNITTGAKNTNTTKISGARLALFAEPVDNLRINIGGIYQNIDNFGSSSQTLVPGTPTPLYGKYIYANFADYGSDIKYRLLNATADYETGIGTITASGNFARYEAALMGDLTNTYVPLVRALYGAPAGPGLPSLSEVLFGRPIDALLPANYRAESLVSPNMDKYTAELRFTSKRLGPIEFIAGAFYTDEKAVYRFDIYVNDTTNTRVPGQFGTLIRTTTTSAYKEWAGFGNLTIYLTDALDVTGGIRYAHNEQVATTGGPGAVAFFRPSTGNAFNFQDNASTYLATVRWRPTQNISTYVRAASGYRPGGPQNTGTLVVPGAQTFIRPDNVWNYEAGIKGSLFDGIFSFDASVFHIDWTDIQLNSLVSGITVQANGGSATVDGFEVSTQIRPTNALTVRTTLGYTDSKIKEIDPNVSAVSGARAGDSMPLVPFWTASLTADHRIDLMEGVIGNVGATVRYQSDMPTNYPANITTQPREVPARTTFDLRASADFDPVTVICPLLSGPKLMIFWMTKENMNAGQEASPGRDYRQAA